jgi:hypothetical protein
MKVVVSTILVALTASVGALATPLGKVILVISRIDAYVACLRM